MLTFYRGPHEDAWNPWCVAIGFRCALPSLTVTRRPMAQVSEIFGTDDDDEILHSLYLIANVSRSHAPHTRLLRSPARGHRTPPGSGSSMNRSTSTTRRTRARGSRGRTATSLRCSWTLRNANRISFSLMASRTCRASSSAHRQDVCVIERARHGSAAQMVRCDGIWGTKKSRRRRSCAQSRGVRCAVGTVGDQM